jgi:UDP-N-acetylglucosamine 2-epimerase
MANATNPYGDGRAAQRIIGIIKNSFGFSHKLPPEFRPRKRP